MPADATHIEDIDVGAVTIPTDAPEADGTAAWDATTMIHVRVHCDGVTGTGWTYGSPACADAVLHHLVPVVVGADPMGVPAMWTQMVRSVRNATRAGVIDYAISAVDIACWDLKARLLDLSLVDLWGGARDEVPVYGSGGFTTYDDQRMADQIDHWVRDLGIPRIKIKIGEDRGRSEERDLRRMRLAREVAGPDAELYVDANGGYEAKQAVRVLHNCSDAGISWYEEPVSSDDLSGLRLVRHQVDADVTAGEYGTDIGYFHRMCAAGSVDCLQVDVTRCGGYTEWIRAATVAAAHELEVSAHAVPHLHAPVAATVPNLRHIELFHDHHRIEQTMVEGCGSARGGVLVPDRAAPGHGMTLRPDAYDELGGRPAH